MLPALLAPLLLMTASPSRAAGDLRYSYARPEPLRINAKALGRCLAIATEELRLPYHSSREIEGLPFVMKDFMDYLEAGPRRRFDYVTGNEEALKAWILGQPDNSIDPVSLYQQSMRLNRGNVWGSILTIHDILRNMARFKEKRRYHYDGTNDAEAAAFFNKLVDIRGVLSDRDPRLLGDHRGSWYRIWGTMLYRLMWDEDQPTQAYGARCLDADDIRVADRPRLKKWMNSVLKVVMPEVASRMVEWSKVGKTYALDPRKAEVNQAGSESIDETIRLLWGRFAEGGADRMGTRYPAQDWKACQGRNYLEKIEVPVLTLPDGP